MIHTLRLRPAKSVLFGLVHRFSTVHPITLLCQKLHVSRSCYYKWLKRQSKPNPDLMIRDHIIAVQQTCDFTIGYRRMIEYLTRRTGIDYNHKRVYRIMSQYGLLSHSPCRAKTKIIRKAAESFTNLINGDFHAQEPNERWSVDLSEFATMEGKIYLCAIEDFHDRAVISHSIGVSPNHLLVKQTIEKAINQIPDHADLRLILHSDQGSTFKGPKYRHTIKKSKIIPSYSAKGSPNQNAIIESFFATLKKECLYRYHFPTRADAIEAIEEFIIFYNTYRIQSSTGLTPFEVRYKVDGHHLA